MNEAEKEFWRKEREAWTSFYNRSTVVNIHPQKAVLGYVCDLTFRVYWPWFDHVKISDNVNRLGMHLIFDVFNYKDTKRVKLNKEHVLVGRMFIDVNRPVETASLMRETFEKHFELLELFENLLKRKKIGLDFAWIRSEFELANELILWIMHQDLKAGRTTVPFGSQVPANIETAKSRQHLAIRY
jgi:hypothetical protein